MFDAVTALPRRHAPGVRAAVGAAALAVALGGIPAVTAPAAATSPVGVQLAAAEGGSLSASDIALIMGPSMMPTPGQQYAETVASLFLQPHGFAGELEVLTTPASPYLLDNSLAQGAEILTARVQSLFETGEIGADHPVTVFGYSQSAALTTLAMQQLHEAGVPSDAVHFVLIGDSANPNGGILPGFDLPGLAEWLLQSDVTVGNPTPSDLYPTDVYTLEYDGYADFPRYSMNLLSSLNAVMGMVTQHLAYLGLTPEQIASATLLESSPDSLVNSYMISSEYLPLLWPMLFVPVIGKPLYDLMEPTMRILVNLGYGNIEHGWNDGPADVPTAMSPDGPNLDWSEVSTALQNAAQTGWDAFTADLVNPETYQVPAMIDSPVVATLLAAAANVGFVDADNPSVPELLQGLTDMFWASLVGDPLAALG
ncbi:PE-PPE domain-containing protein [[Mycobacterium] crassicus]|uniref:PE-PPE domain-containing protein n=1 Tax=[Mycobacterium] crassicus TaxID=2872309 RepID=A0ABU5XPH5_9MYCO|nr:PE-PPE domain-containing protein [Mycolicibacter sp. MYC098]MEB3024114.1 PE-PPE domain-containing protein [Mycolicibacter sp. MYC098]